IARGNSYVSRDCSRPRRSLRLLALRFDRESTCVSNHHGNQQCLYVLPHYGPPPGALRSTRKSNCASPSSDTVTVCFCGLKRSATREAPSTFSMTSYVPPTRLLMTKCPRASASAPLLDTPPSRFA